MGALDEMSEEVVQSTIESYEKEIVKSDTEQAVVITNSGFVWKCHGVKSNVYPDVDVTEFSFSKE